MVYAFITGENQTLLTREGTTSLQNLARSAKALQEAHGQRVFTIQSIEDTNGTEVDRVFISPELMEQVLAAEEGNAQATPKTVIAEVWHKTQPDFGLDALSGRKPTTDVRDRAEFQKVAAFLLADDSDVNYTADAAYSASQNLDSAWNPVARCRSTSVGDIIVVSSGEFAGSYEVAPFGFNKVTFG